MSEVWQDSEKWLYNHAGGNVFEQRFKGRLFDSHLGRNSHPTQNHSLKLYLRIHLKQVNKKMTALDADKESFPVKDWTADEWSRFTSDFMKQSNMWNNRFWLIPPKYYSLTDAAYGGRKLRPNISCFLFTEVTNNPGTAHRTIEVVNLDLNRIKREKRIKNPSSATFRSHETLYDSLDTKPRTKTYVDNLGVQRTVKNHYTVAHEIGHAIGLDHIGVLKRSSQCVFAISLENNGITDVSDHLFDGSNSPVCYGRYDTPGLAENIMGLGTKFEEVNAQPWIDRVAKHTNTLSRDWKVSLSHASPQAVF
jgi:hypothetical protein